MPIRCCAPVFFILNPYSVMSVAWTWPWRKYLNPRTWECYESRPFCFSFGEPVRVHLLANRCHAPSGITHLQLWVLSSQVVLDGGEISERSCRRRRWWCHVWWCSNVPSKCPHPNSWNLWRCYFIWPKGIHQCKWLKAVEMKRMPWIISVVQCDPKALLKGKDKHQCQRRRGEEGSRDQK